MGFEDDLDVQQPQSRRRRWKGDNFDAQWQMSYVRMIGQEGNINREVARLICEKNLGTKKVCAKMVPRNLSNNQWRGRGKLPPMFRDESRGIKKESHDWGRKLGVSTRSWDKAIEHMTKISSLHPPQKRADVKTNSQGHVDFILWLQRDSGYRVSPISSDCQPEALSQILNIWDNRFVVWGQNCYPISGYSTMTKHPHTRRFPSRRFWRNNPSRDWKTQRSHQTSLRVTSSVSILWRIVLENCMLNPWERCKTLQQF
jgi:hypothetical protein